MRRCGVDAMATSEPLRGTRGRRVRSRAHSAAEVMAVRPEDKDARQDQRAFANGATLAKLEQYIAFLRSLGAPDDAHPRSAA